jgi:ATP-dependent Clp protease ATP-binding subunit ClpB
MTSNIGSLHLLDGVTDTGEIREPARELVMGELRSQFRPEFLNRVDEIVLFKPLTLQEIERIVELQIADVRARLADRRVELELSDTATRLIAREGYDPVYGARPLRRFIQREVETRIGRALISGEIGEGARISVESDGEELLVRWRQADSAEEESEPRTGRERAAVTA